MKKLSKNAIIGYPAGIITGVTYGLNPMFAMPLIGAGAAIESILFFRYAFAVVILGMYLWLKKESFRHHNASGGGVAGDGFALHHEQPVSL